SPTSTIAFSQTGNPNNVILDLSHLEPGRGRLYPLWGNRHQVSNPDLIGLDAQRPNPRGPLASGPGMGQAPQSAENDNVTLGNNFRARIYISQDDTVRWRDDPHARPACIADNEGTVVFGGPVAGAFRSEAGFSPLFRH